MTRFHPAISRKSLVSAAVYFVAVLAVGGCDDASLPEDRPSNATLAVATPQPIPDMRPVAEVTNRSRYFFNVKGHTREQVESLLNRALEVYEEMPADSKEELEIAMVLHGPDAQFFAKKNYNENKNLMDLATKLEASGFIDLKVCARSAASQGIDNDGFPPFIEVVPYGPEAIENLKEAGFTEI